jgi:hypothetical protein
MTRSNKLDTFVIVMSIYGMLVPWRVRFLKSSYPPQSVVNIGAFIDRVRRVSKYYNNYMRYSTHHILHILCYIPPYGNAFFVTYLTLSDVTINESIN